MVLRYLWLLVFTEKGCTRGYHPWTILKIKIMKQLKFLLILVIIIAGSALQLLAQTILPEVKIVATKYKYLNAADNKQMAQPVRMLESNVATYDIKKSDVYNDEYEGYSISFYIPTGEILAAYDKDGKLLRTVEKFRNTKLPKAVNDAVTQWFPNWKISQDVYQVRYFERKKTAEKTFKILLENGDKRRKIKMNEKGEFI